MADKIEKIYLIRAEGSGPVIKDLRTINTLFKEIAKSKAILEGQKATIADPAELARVNDQLAKLNQQEAELTQRKNTRLAAAREEISTNQQLKGTYNELTAAIQGATGGTPGAGVSSAQAQVIETLAAAQAELAAATQQTTTATTAQAAAATGQEVAIEGVSAAILAGRAMEKQAEDATLSMAEAQALLNAQYEQTKREMAEVAAIQSTTTTAIEGTAAGAASASESFTAVSARVALIGSELRAVNEQIKTYTAAWEAGEVSTAQFEEKVGGLIEQQAVLKQELSEVNAQLKLQTTLERATASSINEARAKVGELTKERNALNLSTAEGTKRQRELNAQIDQYNKFIRENVDAYQKQKINIGNYPTLTAELRAVKTEMEKLVKAGEQDSQTFKDLSAQAQQLTASLAEVAAATKATAVATEETSEGVNEAAGKFEGFAAKAGKAFGFLRQLAYIIPGLGIAGIFSLLAEGINKAIDSLVKWAQSGSRAAAVALELARAEAELNAKVSEAAGSEIAKLDILRIKIQDVNVPMAQRLQGIKDIQEQFPAYFSNLTREEILAGKVGDAYTKTAEAIRSAARVRVFGEQLGQVEGDIAKIGDRVRAQAKKMSLDVEEMFGGTLRFIQDTPAIPQYLTGEKDKNNKPIKTDIISDITKYNSLLARAADLSGRIQENMGKAATIDPIDKPAKAAKAPADTYREQLNGLQTLTNAQAELQKQRIEQDVQANEAIFQNDKENLEDRLVAYANFSSDRKYQAEALRDKEIENEKNIIGSINKQLGDGKKRTKEDVDSLVALREAANLRITAAQERLQARLQEIDNEGLKAARGIVDSDVRARLQHIEQIKEDASKEAGTRLAVLQDSFQKQEISYKDFKAREKLLADEAHVYELNLIKKYLEEQIAAFKAAGRDTDALQNALSKVNQQLFSAQTKQFDELGKRLFDLQNFYKTLRDTAIDAAGQIAEGWSRNQQRQIDKDLELRRTRLDTEKDARLNAATSAAERTAIEKEYDQKQEALQKEGFERQKRLAESTLAIEFAVASIKAINQALSVPYAGIFEALAAEAVVAIQYAAKLAVLESQSFGAGGEVPTEGGEFGGKPHSRGGTNFSFKGRTFNAEAQEIAILNKRTSQSQDRFTVSGTPKQIASALNAAGGGVQWAPGAKLTRFEYGGSLGAGLAAPYFTPQHNGLDNEALNAFMASAGQGFQAVHSRIDNIKVTLDPKAVKRSNDQRDKFVDIGQL